MPSQSKETAYSDDALLQAFSTIQEWRNEAVKDENDAALAAFNIALNLIGERINAQTKAR